MDRTRRKRAPKFLLAQSIYLNKRKIKTGESRTEISNTENLNNDANSERVDLILWQNINSIVCDKSFDKTDSKKTETEKRNMEMKINSIFLFNITCLPHLKFLFIISEQGEIIIN